MVVIDLLFINYYLCFFFLSYKHITECQKFKNTFNFVPNALLLLSALKNLLHDISEDIKDKFVFEDVFLSVT